MGGGPDDVPERYAIADPIALVPLAIPVLLVHGTDDATVSVRRSRNYAPPRARAGGEVELVEIAGEAGAHRSHVFPDSASWAAVSGWLAARAARRELGRRQLRSAPHPAGATLAGASSSSGPSVTPPATLLTSGFAGETAISSAASGTQSAFAAAASSSGESQACSPSGPGRITGIRSCTAATSELAAVVRIVADSIGSPSSVPGVHRPANANGSPSASVKRNGTRGCFRSSGRSHS